MELEEKEVHPVKKRSRNEEKVLIRAEDEKEDDEEPKSAPVCNELDPNGASSHQA